MEVLIASEDDDGLLVQPVGRHLQAVSIDLAHDPCPVTIKGDAKGITADGVVTALVDPENTTSDGFWFFEIKEPFARPRTLASSTCLLFSLAHVSADIDSTPDTTADLTSRARPTAIVLLSEQADLYLVIENKPVFSEPDWIGWTNYTIALDASMPWRVAGSPETVDGLERLPINRDDRLATTTEIRGALGSLQSLRIRGGQPAQAHLVLLRSLVTIRQTDPNE